MKKYTLVRLPARSVGRGLRMNYLGEVDFALAEFQHQNYCRALEKLGRSLIVMPPDERLPDSVFVEDPAVIVDDTLIITRLRRKERRGEEEPLRAVLAPYFCKVARVEGGFVEGGDVLITHDALYVGVSGRTDERGAEGLARIARDLAGFKSFIFDIPRQYLHLKGEVTFHRSAGGRNLITISEEIADNFLDSGCELIITPQEERFAGNCISAGRKMLIHAGCEKTKSILARRGLDVEELELSEFAKIDGAMTCLSKLFTA